MTDRLKVLTVVGTRPEIIRLAPTIKKLDEYVDHVLVHTGQNYDYELNEIFFEDLGIRRPDYFLEVDTSSLGAMLGSILQKTEAVILKERPDAFLILGDTNSALSAVIAKRLKIPVFHMEAGNRSFDQNVPEEVNRRLVDHVADYNLVYTEHARRNLLSEGIHPSRLLLTGSPMREVLSGNAKAIAESNVVNRENLSRGGYFLVSIHREENVDNPERLTAILRALNGLLDEYALPVLVSTHPRTGKRLQEHTSNSKERLRFHRPFGFNDYISLQQSAKLVLSDSGTIAEESALLGFPAVTLRDSIERPEALDTGSLLTSGTDSEAVLSSVRMTLKMWQEDGAPSAPSEYQIQDTSRRVLSFIQSSVHSHKARNAIR